MKWRRRLYALKQDPYGSSREPGTLHQITLTDDTVDGKPPFEFSTMMYIPLSMEKHQAELNLELFQDNADTQLRQKHDEWRGRDVVKHEQFVL